MLLDEQYIEKPLTWWANGVFTFLTHAQNMQFFTLCVELYCPVATNVLENEKPIENNASVAFVFLHLKYLEEMHCHYLAW